MIHSSSPAPSDLNNSNFSDFSSTTPTIPTSSEIRCDGEVYELLGTVGRLYAYAHGYIGLTVAAVGVAANAANIGVLTRPHMHSCTNLLLTALAIADLLTVASFLPIYPHFYIWRTADAEPFETPYPSASYYLFFQASFVIMLHFAAVWITIAVAFFRWVCVRWPLSGSRFCSFRNAQLAIAMIVVAALLANIPNVLCNTISTSERALIAEQNENRTLYSVGIHERCEVGTRLRDLNAASLAFGIRFIPSVALTALTLLLLNEMHKVNVRFINLRISKSSSASAHVAIFVADANNPGSSQSPTTKRPTDTRGRQATLQPSVGSVGGQFPSRKSISCGQLHAAAAVPGYLQLPGPNQYQRTSSSLSGSNASLGRATTSTCKSATTRSQRPSIFGIGAGIGNYGMRVESMTSHGGGRQSPTRCSVTPASRSVRFGAGTIDEIPRSGSVESRRLRESNRTTQMLLWVVAMFLLVEFPQGVLHVASSADSSFDTCGYQKLGDLLDLETLVMNTAKIVLYASMSRQFRHTFTEILLRMCVALHVKLQFGPQKSTSPPGSAYNELGATSNCSSRRSVGSGCGTENLSLQEHSRRLIV